MPLAELPEVELVDGSPSELMALAFELSEAAWALSGRAMPDYPRDQIPGRLVRRPQ